MSALKKNCHFFCKRFPYIIKDNLFKDLKSCITIYWRINFDYSRYFSDTEISDIVDIEQDDQPSSPWVFRTIKGQLIVYEYPDS